MLFVYSSFERPFCQGIASKKFARQACKIFRALDNIIKLKFINSGRHSLPSALIAKKHTLFIVSSSSLDMCLFPFRLSSCQRLLFAPLDKGADVPFSLAFRLWGYEEFWGSQGETRKIPPGRFRFLLRPKGRRLCVIRTLCQSPRRVRGHFE